MKRRLGMILLPLTILAWIAFLLLWKRWDLPVEWGLILGGLMVLVNFLLGRIGRLFPQMNSPATFHGKGGGVLLVFWFLVLTVLFCIAVSFSSLWGRLLCFAALLGMLVCAWYWRRGERKKTCFSLLGFGVFIAGTMLYIQL